MKLLLTSSGVTNSLIGKALRAMAGKPPQKTKVAFIYTAALGDSGDKGWLIDDLHRLKELGYYVDLIDFAGQKKSQWLPIVQASDVIFVGGGNTFYLSYWFEKSGFFEMLPKLLKSKVYVGISAGSMIVTQSLQTSSKALAQIMDEEYDEPGPRGMASTKTARLVDFTLRPHLDSPHFPKIRKPYLAKVAQKIKTRMYAIDDQTAIKVIDGKIEIISEGKWIRFN